MIPPRPNGPQPFGRYETDRKADPGRAVYPSYSILVPSRLEISKGEDYERRRDARAGRARGEREARTRDDLRTVRVAPNLERRDPEAMEATRKESKMLRPKRTKRAPARRPFLTEGAPKPGNLATPGAKLRATIDPRNSDGTPDRPFGEVRTSPPSWVLDKIAEETLTGGFSRKANAICGTCGAMKTTRGVCFCDAPGPELFVSKIRTEAKPTVACKGCGMRPSKGEDCLCP